jgi:predicted restriction endonuclease
MTQERTLTVLEAAHIRPYRQNGTHDIRNACACVATSTAFSTRAICVFR